MNAVLLSADLLRPRTFLHCPPRGTPSRILRLRLQHERHGRRRMSQSPVAGPPSAEGANLLEARHSNTLEIGRTFSQEEFQLLRKVMQTSPLNTISPPQDRTGTPVGPNPDPESLSIDVAPQDLLRVLEDGSTRKLYIWLSQADEIGQEAVANLPPTTFSEFLRCLDPFAVSKELDHAHDMHIDPSLAQLTMLGQYVNCFGIRLVNVFLLARLLPIFEKRLATSHGVLLQDYLVLIRCAGAASDIQAAKKIWHDMEANGHTAQRQSEAYTEFIKARFLTDPLYTQFDPPRFRVRPLNLHKEKITLPRGRVMRLERLRKRLQEQSLTRFGDNPDEPAYAEHITRILRKTKPVKKLFHMVKILNFARDERLLAAVIVAMGRNGSLRAINELLAASWKISVEAEEDSREVEVRGGADFPHDSPMRPTARLLEAIVHAYCSNGELATALKVMDYISRRYNLHIPDKLWFDLLTWTHVMVSKPTSTEWQHAGFPRRVLKSNAIDLVWSVMTSEPYNVKPTFAQYNVYIRGLINQRKYREAVELIREIRSTYDGQLLEYEDATLELSHTMLQEVGHSAAVQLSKRAAVKKWTMWCSFRSWFRQMFKKIRPRRIDDPFIVRTIPDIIDEFRAFMPREMEYRTATGYVLLKEPRMQPRYLTLNRVVYDPTIRPLSEQRTESSDEHGDQPIMEYDPSQQRLRLQRRLRQRQLGVRQAITWAPDLRSLANRSGTKLNPWLLREFT